MNNLPVNPQSLRNLIRQGKLSQPTSGMAPGHVQANLAILPKSLAFEFLLFCQRNPKPCPLIEVVEAGSVEPVSTAPGADLRTDIPKYMIFEHGEMVAEVNDISEFWNEDFVSFLLGCSFSFENSLIRAGISLRHFENGTNVAMYVTNIPTKTSGLFSGPMVVSMRPIPRHQVVRAVQITSRFPGVHGAPVHIGDPKAIGIDNIYEPDMGDLNGIKKDEIPVFWACGVTPQLIAMNSKPPLMITHSPGHMFITDIVDEDLAIF